MYYNLNGTMYIFIQCLCNGAENTITFQVIYHLVCHIAISLSSELDYY